MPRRQPVRLVEDANGCWIWPGAKDHKGYGIGCRGNRTWRMHRWFYEKMVGPIPDDLTIDHLCKNTSCVNPDHMEVVTRGENNRRASPLTDDDVREIRQLVQHGVKQGTVGKMFGITQAAVSRISRGRRHGTLV